MPSLANTRDTAASHLPLSPARAALASHISAQQAQLGRLRQLDEPAQRAARAAERYAQAELRLEAVAELEAERVRDWSANPSGPMPAPLADERNAALGELAEATHEAETTRRDADALAETCRAEERQLFELNKQTPGLIDAVLVEDAAHLGAQLREALFHYVAVLAALHAIRAHFRKKPECGQQAAYLDGLIRACSLRRDSTSKPEIQAAFEYNFKRFATLASSLSSEPSTRIATEPNPEQSSEAA